ncbi:fungal specific transcription factor domain containing protein [Pyrenophora tritici-repentis]|uniref:Fungal specific transcription factor domain containing protein n=2 Tax=Pyrenophora tritici-repentis TaxID=45151 RepID=A0A2W1FHX2_9PLEO|nr:fungal specific transcription factor domain containing protein [Pyrenophora tritici-repentis Pt-1C-BFP]KAA8624551.1 Fungal specific transcription factor domain-containing protein [Pyrenophora tritici-repentis]EDU44575.1 fungal specific transcription factor domain containing protein [Pyrenophora tritici-repentis Pt-1C-BFP]KAF7452952.1 Fungal specific transcription factor domain containing protein [Pyrenophora tritici-repentis]KAF7575997.1 fungal specific transcription factor domain containing
MITTPQSQRRKISETPAKDESNGTTLKNPRAFPSSSVSIDRPDYACVNTANPSTSNAAADYTNPPSSRDSPVPQGGQRDQQGHYVGSSSAVSFLIRIQRRLHQDSSLSHDSTIFTFGDAPLPEFDLSLFLLPPKPDAQRLVERYFDYAAPTHRFLHRPSIEKLVEEFYETQGEMRGKEDGKAKAALLMVVFAQAQAYMPPGSAVRNNSARYFFAAEHQLSKERGAVRLASVQARLLQCFYLLTQSRINHCWSLFGTLSHLVLAIGLNRSRRCDPSNNIDYVELECRRRLFWCAYSLDKYLAAALGRPRTFKDEDIDQELPTVVNDSDLLPNYIKPTAPNCHSVMTAPVEHIKLTRIVSLVLRDLYCIRPPSLARRIELSTKYTSDLHAWHNSLSGFLAGSGFEGGFDSQLLIPIYQRQRSVLNLAYHHALLLIHRPFLLRDFASLTHMPTHPNWSANPVRTHDTSTNITACLEAAMAILRIVDDVFISSNLFRSFWFTQYYAFCAVVVLYVHRIQQGLGVEMKVRSEGYFEKAVMCQRQLETVSDTDCLARRYCLVLEELRVEAVRQSGRLLKPVAATSAPVTEENSAEANPDMPRPALLPMPTSTPQDNPPSPTGGLSNTPYNGNVPATPDSAAALNNPIFNSDLFDWSDLASWGQFEGLVTAGNGMYDRSMLADDGDFQVDFGL